MDLGPSAWLTLHGKGRKVFRVIEWPERGGKQWLVEETSPEVFFPLMQLEREDGRTAEQIIDAGLKV